MPAALRQRLPDLATNAEVRRQRIADKLEQCLRDSGIDPDGPPPPDALPIEETLAIIRDEIRSRKSRRALTRHPGA